MFDQKDLFAAALGLKIAWELKDVWLAAILLENLQKSLE